MGQIKVEKNVGGIEGLCVIEPAVHGDARGYFMETYNEKDMKEAGIDIHFVQDTIARKNMNRKQTGRYDAYNLTYGNRPELFGAGSPTYSGGTTGSIGTGGGTGGSGGGFKYDIPSEALSDEKFARMIEEAEKYLGIITLKNCFPSATT